MPLLLEKEMSSFKDEMASDITKRKTQDPGCALTTTEPRAGPGMDMPSVFSGHQPQLAMQACLMEELNFMGFMEFSSADAKERFVSVAFQCQRVQRVGPQIEQSQHYRVKSPSGTCSSSFGFLEPSTVPGPQETGQV